jgi:hypothetical protein
MSIFKHWGFTSWIFFAVLWILALNLTGIIYQAHSDIERIAQIACTAFIAVMIVGVLNSKVERMRRRTLTVADSRGVAARRPTLDGWQQLGTDPEERERSINRIFDAQIGTAEFDSIWDFDYSHTDSSGVTETAYSSMSFHIVRNLATMDNHDREFLRATYLLYNANLIDLQTWRELSFCFVYGDGKASIMSCEYREPIELPFNDGPGAIKYFANYNRSTVESALSKVRSIIECYAQEPNVPPIVQLLMSRMQIAAA